MKAVMFLSARVCFTLLHAGEAPGEELGVYLGRGFFVQSTRCRVRVGGYSYFDVCVSLSACPSLIAGRS